MMLLKIYPEKYEIRLDNYIDITYNTCRYAICIFLSFVLHNGKEQEMQMTIAEMLLRRKRLGLDQLALSRLCKIAVPTLSAAEDGWATLSEEKMQQIADALDKEESRRSAMAGAA
jgi:hypothetical protein